MIRTFLLQCPQCKQRMKYMPVRGSDTLFTKKKKCVYCGKSFSVRMQIVDN